MKGLILYFDPKAQDWCVMVQWRWRVVVCVSVFLGHCALSLRLSSVTEDVKLGNAYGHVAGFADFNADKTTDILFRAGTP